MAIATGLPFDDIRKLVADFAGGNPECMNSSVLMMPS